MKIVCAWCGKHIESIEEDQQDKRVSYGICKKCQVVILEDLKKKRNDAEKPN